MVVVRRLIRIAAVAAAVASGFSAGAAELIEVAPIPSKGFEYPYLLVVPRLPKDGLPQYLLVETNNTGHADDDLEVHCAAAFSMAWSSGVGNYVSDHLGLPFLVPVFPRPASAPDVYTHCLDRDTILIRDGPLHRIDLQLMAMIEDAKIRLAALGRPVAPKILITGFSASGLFANRFTFLHPEIVAAAAYGGLNSFIMAPVSEIKSQPLEYPLGLADYQNITGHQFDRATYGRVPQFAYMGELDDNDAVLYDDAYPEPERSLVFNLFGRKMMPDRWKAVQALYQQQHLPVQFKTYAGYGHGTNEYMNSELAEFFRRAIRTRPEN